MKKKIIFVLIIFGFFFFPFHTYALEETSYIDTNTKGILEEEELSFSDLLFQDHATDSTLSFGIAGTVFNRSNTTINYKSTIIYYDKDYHEIARTSALKVAKAGTNNFSQMSNLIILNGQNVSDISFYQLKVEKTDKEIISSSNITPSESDQYRSYDYVIDGYDVDIFVKENNTFDITETITSYFNIPKHGIFRTIPLRNKITRLNGTTSTNRAKVTNLEVNQEYQTSRSNGNYKIQIGNPNQTLTGKQTYVIKYTYNLGKDPIKDYDELYYNIIGNEWDTVIGNVTFSITMPKEFDESKLGFSSGMTGSTDNSKVSYHVDGKKISGSYNGILDAYEALTVRCELEEGYFVGAGLNDNFSVSLVFIIPIVFLFLSIFLWYFYGRDHQVIETVEFYPPKGVNSLEAGFLYKGKAENKDVISLLIYLANKGYIAIKDTSIDTTQGRVNLSDSAKEKAKKKIIELQQKIEEEKKKNPNSSKLPILENQLNVYKDIDKPIDYDAYGLTASIKRRNKKNNFVIKKIKDYDGDNMNEQWFMEGLFEFGRTEVTSDMLYHKFYITKDRILHNMNNKSNKDKIYEKSSSNKRILLLLMIVIIYCLITILPIFSYGETDLLLFAILFPGIGFSVLFVMVFGTNNIIEKIFGLIWGSIFGGVPWCFIVFPVLQQDLTYFIGYIVGLLCVLGIIICFQHMLKRTPYGTEMLGKLKGLKTFLTVAEKDKLESLVMENPTYFYDILPYTYVLGVSDKWIKKFETISIQAPTWYDGMATFDVTSFGTFMDSTMTSAEKVMSSSPSSSGDGFSSGGSSGGGSSGGGSGGGGGGSW